MEQHKMQNIIKREIIINAPKERVYKAIATPEQLVFWFPETLEGEFKVGSQPIFGFGDHGRNQIYIVDAKPHEYFAFRWIPGATNFLGDVLTVATTLVEFLIQEESAGQCKVTVIESGFDELPTELIAAAFEQNSGGWDFMLGRLLNYFEKA